MWHCDFRHRKCLFFQMHAPNLSVWAFIKKRRKQSHAYVCNLIMFKLKQIKLEKYWYFIYKYNIIDKVYNIYIILYNQILDISWRCFNDIYIHFLWDSQFSILQSRTIGNKPTFLMFQLNFVYCFDRHILTAIFSRIL